MENEPFHILRKQLVGQSNLSGFVWKGGKSTLKATFVFQFFVNV